VIVLDTHALIWWVAKDAALGAAALDGIRTEQDKGEHGEILVSAISAWEIAMLVKSERLTLSMSASAWLDTVAHVPAVRFIPVDTRIATASVGLPGDFHKDPADRIIVATARLHKARLATADGKIRAYPHVETIW